MCKNIIYSVYYYQFGRLEFVILLYAQQLLPNLNFLNTWFDLKEFNIGNFYTI